MENNRNARQILAFGEQGQSAIEKERIGIVGLGGLGSPVAQGLAYLGARSFVLVDDDRLTDTSLNRVVGAFPDDIGEFKVVLAHRHIAQINPSAIVRTIPRNLRARESIEALLACTTIFGCVDHDAPRLIMMELAAAYGITLIDLATQIFPAAENRPFDFGGRVVFCRPGDFCLACAGQIDFEIAKQELESAEIQAVRRAHGYGLEETAPAASVVSLNGIIAHLGITEFMVSVTGIRNPERMLSYRGMRGVVKASDDKAGNNCFTCAYLAGKGSNANIWRYLLPEGPVRKAA